MSKQTADRYLALVAARCRDAYIRERTAYEMKLNPKLKKQKPPYVYKPSIKWDGGVDGDGKEYKPVWIKLAKFVIEYGLEPYNCVRIRFNLCKGSNPPYPTQIAVNTYLEHYLGQKEVLDEEELAIRFKSEKLCCVNATSSTRYNRIGMKSKDVWKDVLSDDLLELSPLLRYCVAKQVGLEDVAKSYSLSALEQYSMAPRAYDSVWGNAIPEQFREEARYVYRLAIAKDGGANG